MGCTNSKTKKSEALRLCTERRRLIKQAIDSRYSLAAAHLSYLQSLRNIGIALRQYAEAEILIEPSLLTSDKTPSHSSYPSPSPSHVAEVLDSPLHNESPISPPVAALSYMRSRGSAALTFVVNPNGGDSYVDEESMAFPMPPPPPPPLESGSWDFFDPIDDSESFRFVGQSGLDVELDDMSGWRQFKSKVDLGGTDERHEGTFRPKSEQNVGEIPGNIAIRYNTNCASVERNAHLITSRGFEGSQQTIDGKVNRLGSGPNNVNRLPDSSALEKSSSNREKTMAEKELCTEREDPSEFITHRAKDFLLSIKDIEHRFFRASESGREVSRMLEANKIGVGFSEMKGKSSALALGAFQLVCCHCKPAFVTREPSQNVTKVITWKRTASSRSSSSRNPLGTASKEDTDDSISDFGEEFCMIAGSHSSTLDRLYAWERKIYDEVKASESIRKEYERRCNQLRQQFAKDCSTSVIDKTRAVVKDLHSQIRVAIHSVDLISKRIEKIRDEELQPQLVELIQGLTRMWKAMLECHHAQYITISLAYHSRTSARTPQGTTHGQMISQLQYETECFGLSFANWINSLTSYVEAINGWLQICILPREPSKSRRPLSPRRVLFPPIFVLCRDWSARLKDLPSDELSNAIKSFSLDVCQLITEHAELLQKKQKPADPENGEAESKENEDDDASSNLFCIQTSLTKILDRLKNFSEASLKMYEGIRQQNEEARISYLKCGPTRT
ncbi:protein ALTERED PHOSPHATE STARVATION RESPONSE 1 [Juglans microcarpa x Juglans regia]|uniref:protein ALTERED PHOSPHATE STARVATION RESPONSE 1 n=1 Tax=Juglans microcarpa x Juglans regia TaxID=2249226 RepID=UPI001B7F2E3C|nr:protein ALTERED PHOSPHATE STARVATION RESPONSE 1 [Juglans microcarpa x Juglans regia]